MIYLDNAATTKPSDRVIKLSEEIIKNDWINPSALYDGALAVSNKIKNARNIIAELIKVKPSEITFTSGATEGNNTVLRLPMWKNIVVSGLVMTSLLLLPLMAAAGGHHGGGHGPRGYRNVDQWLQSLPEEQQVKARAILEEARPAIEDTRWRIRQKREELAHFDYAEDSSAETLSRLGWELQDLRDRLRLQLAQLEGRLLDEVGVSFRRAGKSRGCNSMIRQDVIHTYSLQETLEPCP